MRTTSHVANFENINLKDLRITPASLRLRRVVIGMSIGYICVFTPILGYFIWNYMMAQPNVRTHGVDSGAAAKPCSNRRLPSLHFALHKGGRRGADAANSSAPPPLHGDAWQEERHSEKYLDLGADLSGGHASAANSSSVGGGTQAAPAVVARQQAAEAAGYRIQPQAALIHAKVSDDSSSSGRVRAEGPPPRRLMLPRQQQQEQPREPGKQPEEGSGGQVKPQSTSRRDYPQAPPLGINQMPVRIGLQEMALGHGREDESASDGDGVPGRSRPGAGTADDKSSAEMLDSGGSENGDRSGVLYELGDAGVPALVRDETDAKYGEEEMGFPHAVFSHNGRKGKPQPISLDGSAYQDSSGHVVDASGDKATLNNLKTRLQSYSQSSRQREDKTDEFYEVESSKKLASYANSVKTASPDQDGRDEKSVLSLEIQNKTAAQLWRLRAEKLKLLLRKQRKMAKQLKDSESLRVEVTGRSNRNEPSETANRADIGFQKELVQLTSVKKWSRKQVPPMSGRGVRTNEHDGDSAAPSELNSAEQRLIEGMASSNKEDNEVLSFAEFFKNHLSPKQRHLKAYDGLKNAQGRRLVIDYAAKRKGKEALVEGFEAGGWPEKPEEPSPTKYTLDPFHPYIARRGAGWDFYNPLKPATERNDARQLAEQEFYSPDQQPIGVRRRLSRRFWAAPGVTSAAFFRLNETSITRSQLGKSPGEGLSIRQNGPGRARVAGQRPAVSAKISNDVPSFKTWPEGNVEESPQNNLSLTLLGHYEVTNETVDAGSQGLSAHVGQAAKIWRRSQRVNANDSLESNRPPISVETERRNTSRDTWASTQKEKEEYPFGRLSRDEAPRNKVSPSHVDTPVNLTVKAADKGTAQREAYHKGADSHPKATRIVLATDEGQKGMTRIESATDDAAQKNTKSEPRPRGAIPQKNKPDAAFREEEARKIPINLVTAPSTSQRAAIQNVAGNGNAGGVRGLMNVEPIPIEGPEFNLSAEVNLVNVTIQDVAADWVSMQTVPRNYEDIVPEEDRNVLSSPFHREQRGNATRFREEGERNISSTELPPPHLMGTSNSTQNFEPEAMHLTPPKVGLASQPKGYFTRSRRGLSSPEPAQSEARATDLLTDDKDNDFDDFHHSEDKYLRIDVKTIKKLDIPTEPSNVDIGIQNKVRKAAQPTASPPVAPDEVVTRGVIKIFNGKRSSSTKAVTEGVSSIQSSSKIEHPMMQTGAPLRVPGVANDSDISPETKHRYTFNSSQLLTESTFSWTGRVTQEMVVVSAANRTSNALNSSLSASNDAKGKSKEEPKSRFMSRNATKETHPSIDFDSGDVSITALKLRTEQPTGPSGPNLKHEGTSGVAIEIAMKTRGAGNITNNEYGVPFVRIAAKNASHTTPKESTHNPAFSKKALVEDVTTLTSPSQRSVTMPKNYTQSPFSSTESTMRAAPSIIIAARTSSHTALRHHTSSRAFSKRALVEDVTTLMPPSQGSVTMEKKHAKSTVSSTESSMRALPFVRIAVGNSSRTTSRDRITAPASDKKDSVEQVATLTPPSYNSGTMPRKHTQSTIPSKKPVTEDKSLSASSDHFTGPSAPVAGKKDLFDRHVRTTNGKMSAREAPGRHAPHERSSSPTSSEDISERFYFRETRHPEDEKTSMPNRTTLDMDTISQKHPRVTPTKQVTAKSSGRTQLDGKAPTSTMPPADDRLFIKREMPASDLRTAEKERASKRTAWTSTSLSTGSTAKEEPPEFTSGAVRHPKRSDNEGIEKNENLASMKSGTPNITITTSKGDSKLLSSSNAPEKGRNLSKFGYATEPSKPAISASEPSKHETGTAASTMRVIQENKAKTFVSKNGNSPLATSSASSPWPAKFASTASTALPTFSDTSIPELGFGDDMLGRLGDANKMPKSTFGEKEPKSTARTPLRLKQPAPTWAVSKPHIEVIPLTTETEQAASKSSRPAVEREPRQKPQETTTATTEPTVVVFDVGDDEEVDEARLHFPMMKIRRRPSTTPRVPAIMDLFGRGLLTSHRTTTLRPVLQHHIAVRRGRPERDPTLRPRLEHDIAMKRRHHRSGPPRPYQMTLFHDEPLQAVRIAVRRMG